MNLTRREVLCAAAASAAPLSGCGAIAPTPKAGQPPVHQVDHIMIRTGEPDGLFAFFTEVLQLPVAWPLALRGVARSGGVGFGNVNVEAIEFSNQAGDPSLGQLLGFGFEPAATLEECLLELDRRGIAYGERRPVFAKQPDGSEMTLFTNVTLRPFSDTERPADATIHVFVSEYSPAYVDVDARRARLRTELTQRAGGPLGIRAVREIVVGATDLDEALGQWEALLAPVRPAMGVWQLGDGPAIRVVRSDENRLRSLVVVVDSLERARGFLGERGFLGSISARRLTIDPARIHGLDIVLVEE